MGNLTAPTMPDATSTYNAFGGVFSNAGTIGLYVVGAAIALGAIILVAKFGWGVLKGWLSKAK